MKKVVALLLAATMAVSAFAGCGKKEGEKKITEDGKVQIRFSSWDDAADLDAQQALVDRFNESQDKIEVVLEAYGNDYDTKVTASMGAGDAPDVMMMWDYPVYSDGLEPLDAYLEKEGKDFKENYYEALWPYHSQDEKIYGLPVGFVTSCLYYNKDLFDKAGLEYPTSDWTWDDVEAAAKTITEKVEGTKGLTFPMKTLPYTFEMYLWSNGSAFVDKEGNLEGNLNSEESLEAFKMFQDWEKAGIANAAEKSSTDELLNGTAAMYVYGTWAIDKLDEAGVNYGIVEIPSFVGKGDSVSVLNTAGVAISKDSKNKEEAWEFIKFWTGEEANKARIGYELPALKSVVKSEKIMEDETYKPFYVMLEQSKGYTPASFIVDGWTEIDEAIGNAIERIYNPNSLEDPKAVLDEVAGSY